MCDFFSWQTTVMDLTNTSSSSAHHDLGDLADIVRAGDRPAAAEMEFFAGGGDHFGADLSGFEDLIAPPPATSMMSMEHGDLLGASAPSMLGDETATMRSSSVNAAGSFTRMMASPPTMLPPMSTSTTTTTSPAPGSMRPPPAAPIGPLAGDGGAGPIATPRSTPAGMKRRKSQVKKVVCVPAPAAASNRQSGEVVPSDHWAWRKYGQKPIKGSPYPRGYYRCSSSKGCSARKQVERCRTDPNMLLITYTSEHNHPWPPQRKSLAARSHLSPSPSSSPAPTKNAAAAKSFGEAAVMSAGGAAILKVEDSCNNGGGGGAAVHYESGEQEFDEMVFGQGNYRTLLAAELGGGGGDFFAELAELESDPVSLIFSGGGGAAGGQEYARIEKEEVVGDEEMMMIGGKVEEEDPFGIFDWGGDVDVFDSKATTTLKNKSNNNNYNGL